MGGTVLFDAVPQVRGTAFYTVGPGSSGRAFHQGVRVRADHYHSVGPGGSAVWCRGVGLDWLQQLAPEEGGATCMRN